MSLRAIIAVALAALLGLRAVLTLLGRRQRASGSPRPAPPPPGPVVQGIIAALMYVIGPLRLLGRHELVPTRAALPVPSGVFDALPEQVRQYITRTEATLQQIGFGPGVRMVSDATVRARSYASLLEHGDHTVLATVSLTQSDRVQNTEILFLRSELADGTVMVTSNGRLKRRFPRRPGYDALSFPKLSDPIELLKMHRFRVTDRAAPARQVSRAPDPIEHQRREMRETYDHFLRIGYYRRSPTDTLRLTPKGAVCTTWRGKFPWAQITDWRDEQRRQSVLARYDGSKPWES
jgi:hypothetical protein